MNTDSFLINNVSNTSRHNRSDRNQTFSLQNWKSTYASKEKYHNDTGLNIFRYLPTKLTYNLSCILHEY